MVVRFVVSPPVKVKAPLAESAAFDLKKAVESKLSSVAAFPPSADVIYPAPFVN